MRVAVFSTEPWDRDFLERENERRHQLEFFTVPLAPETTALARDYPAVCVFVHDRLNAVALEQLAAGGTRFVALRCAGFNNVDLTAAERLGIRVVRVPAYSPEAVAEHAVALMLALDRHIHRAWNRVREGNFSLRGLLGFNLNGRTAGIVGTGRIGQAVARILHGFGCRLLGCDPAPVAGMADLGLQYVPLDELLAQSDIVTLHCPLTPETHHLIDAAAIAKMRPGAMLINTSRGAVVDTRALIAALKSRRLGSVGLDVYEQEGDVFFRDLSDEVLTDDMLARLLTFPNVLITSHQGFFTAEALTAIARTTLDNLDRLERGEACDNELHAGTHVAPG
ncbi:MAG: 2-hydroxyacid dehydrogenase [Gammaproteobacteria bacterium]|nr:MAG: 2-hydroxyacid dehydrogenase [Gammaproteobacteria bacterium]